MSGPRIYTEAWERLRTAAREPEAREQEEPKYTDNVSQKPERLRGPRLLVIATVVLAFLSILTASLWVDSQARLMTAARDVTDFRVRLELLQATMKKVEEEKQRLEEENGRLSIEYEQRASELAQLEGELQAVRALKARSRSEPKQPVTTTETQPLKPANAPKTVQEPAFPTPREKGSALKYDTPEPRDIKTYTIN